jgi:acetophenone carboxylase
MEDLKKNVISEWTVTNVYKVVFAPENRKIDRGRTEQLRADERKARLRRGKSYDEFMAEWDKLSPPKDILQYYGTWPDAKPTGPVFRP